MKTLWLIISIVASLAAIHPPLVAQQCMQHSQVNRSIQTVNHRNVHLIADVSLVYYPCGHIQSGISAVSQTLYIQQQAIPVQKGSLLVFYEDGSIKKCYPSLPIYYQLHGQGTLPIAAHSEFVVYPNGSIKRAIVQQRCWIQNSGSTLTIEAHTMVNFHENQQIKSCILATPHWIRDGNNSTIALQAKSKASFYPSGLLRKGTLQCNTYVSVGRYRSLPLRAHTEIHYYPSGQLMQGVLAHNFYSRSHQYSLRAGSQLTFDNIGRLHCQI